MKITYDEMIELAGALEANVVNDNPTVRSRVWTCVECNKVSAFKRPTRPVAPCSCGSVCFEKRGVAELPA